MAFNVKIFWIPADTTDDAGPVKVPPIVEYVKVTPDGTTLKLIGTFGYSANVSVWLETLNLTVLYGSK